MANKLTMCQQELISDYLSDNYAKVKWCIHSTIKRSIPAEQFEDYIGVAELALIKAARRFKPERGTKFSTFASMNIRSAIKTRLTYENRHRRLADKTAISLESKVADGLRVMDLISDNTTMEVQEYERIQNYLDRLPKMSKMILAYRLVGFKDKEIAEELKLDNERFKYFVHLTQKYENTKWLRKEEQHGYIKENQG